QVVRLDRYVAALLVFVPLDDLAAVDWTEPRNHILIAHTLTRRFVYPVKVDAFLFGGRRLETHPYRHQRKLEEAGPVRSRRSSHRRSPRSPNQRSGRQPVPGRPSGGGLGRVPEDRMDHPVAGLDAEPRSGPAVQ